MKKIGCIPLRKGSKGIVNKNKRKLVGRPLFCWVLGEAMLSDLDEVVVFTDDIDLIRFVESQYTWAPKVRAILRNNENASDTASTESALLEFAEKLNYEFDMLCLLQATSPFTTSEDINRCIASIEKDSYDASLTVVNSHRFTWSKAGKPLNYDVFNRPRRQDFEGLLIENGAVFCTTKKAFVDSENRVSGAIDLVQMPEESLCEIDSETDWLIVEALLIDRLKKQKETHKLTHLVLDVDGVFTDGMVSYSKDGELTKQFDMRDGMGLEIIREQGIQVFVMTSEDSKLVAKRMEKLKIEQLFLGTKDKYALLQDILMHKGVPLSQVAYVGDDVNDLANMCRVGWSMAPNNATNIIKQHADMVLSKASGRGAIREACEFIINYNKRF